MTTNKKNVSILTKNKHEQNDVTQIYNKNISNI